MTTGLKAARRAIFQRPLYWTMLLSFIFAGGYDAKNVWASEPTVAPAKTTAPAGATGAKPDPAGDLSKSTTALVARYKGGWQMF